MNGIWKWFILPLAVGGISLGLWGFFNLYPPKDLVLDSLNNLWRTLALFVMQSNVDAVANAKDNWQVVLARLLIPAATLSATLQLCAGYIAGQRKRRQLLRMRGHTVIVGISRFGEGFLEHSKGPVAVLDLARTSTKRPSHRKDVLYHSGDGRDIDALKAVGAPHADMVLILGPSDAVNLDVLSRVIECRTEHARQLTILVRLTNRALARQLDREDEFVRRGLGNGLPRTEEEARVEIVPFYPERIAAQQFLNEYPLVDLADLRAQPRVHVVIVGWTGFAFEVMEQLARLAPYRDFLAPRADLFVRRPMDVVSAFSAAQPAFLSCIVPEPAAAGAREPDSGLPPLLEIHLHDLDGESGLPTFDQIRSIEPQDGPLVTATIVTLESDDSSAAVAMALRDRLTIEGRWQGPIFVKLDGANTMSQLLESRAKSADLADRIIPVGSIASTCRLESFLGARETAARDFHNAYLSGTGGEKLPIESRAANQMPWPLLAQTYRSANRRVVDHLPVKLLSAGYLVGGAPFRISPDSGFGASAEERHALAALEHRSWEVDRLLDGWRGGKTRDNRARINDALGVPFDLLDETLGREVRRFDFEQIDVAARMLTSTAGEISARREIRIGIVGHNFVSAADLERIRAALEKSFPGFIAEHREAAISVFTPLAPGTDLILTEIVCEMLRHSGIQHRVVVVRTLPYDVVVQEFCSNSIQGGVWSATKPPNSSARPDAQIRARIDEFLSQQERLVIVNLLAAGSKMEDWQAASAREKAYRLANAYLVSRCHSILAFHDPARDGKGGGTAEALAWARNTRLIPEDYRFLRRAGTTPKLMLV